MFLLSVLLLPLLLLSLCLPPLLLLLLPCCLSCWGTCELLC
jgi:hypothetical protein